MRIVIVMVLAALLAGCGTAEPTAQTVTEPTPDLATLDISPIVIETVDVRIAESAPPQIFVEVAGYLGDGCTRFHDLEQVREGNTFTITITGERPKDAMCTAIAEPYSENIALGTLEPGSYTVIVNGVRADFEL